MEWRSIELELQTVPLEMPDLSVAAQTAIISCIRILRLSVLSDLVCWIRLAPMQGWTLPEILSMLQVLALPPAPGSIPQR
jgi:hypothetical protein